MVGAKAEVDLRLTDFAPRSQLKVAAHMIERPRFPVIDFHDHPDSLEILRKVFRENALKLLAHL